MIAIFTSEFAAQSKVAHVGRTDFQCMIIASGYVGSKINKIVYNFNVLTAN